MYANDLYYLQSEIEYRREATGRFPRRRRRRLLETHYSTPRNERR